MNKQFKLWSMVIVFVLGCFATGAYARDVNVFAQGDSVNNGAGTGKLVNIVLNKGDVLVINTGKRDVWSLGSGRRTSNANGLGNPFGDDFGNLTIGNFSFLFGSLVGSLDNGRTFFPVGTHLEQTILTENPGKLRLYAWDSNFSDNSGFIEAEVHVIKAGRRDD